TRPGQFHVGSVTGPMTSGTPAVMQVSGVSPIPSSGVAAVVFNVTVTGQTGDGNLVIYPHGGTAPNVANLNYRAGEAIGSRVVVPVGSSGQVDVDNYTLHADGSAGGSTHVVADAVGYFTDASAAAGAGSTFSGMTPVRIADTRAGQFRIGPNDTLGDFST